MADNFDPYWEWLRIPVNEQPPNHYRLLRLTPLESNPQVIESAVNQLVERMHKLSQGNQVAYAQKILNDIAKANICLSDPKKKLEYDTQLKASRSQSQNVNKPNTSPAPAQPQQQLKKPEPKTSPPKQETNATSSKSVDGLTLDEQKRVKLMRILAPLMALAGAASGILLVWALASGNSESASSVAKNSNSEKSQPAPRNIDAPPEKKSSFSEVANIVAKEMELENEVAEKEEAIKSEPEKKTSTAPTTPVSTKPNDTIAEAPGGAKKQLSKVGDAYAPDDQPLFETLVKEEIFLEGKVVNVRSSTTGKTHYLTFGKGLMETIYVMARADDISFEKLSPLMGKQVRVRGIVEKESQRVGLRIKSFDQIQVQDK